MFFYVREMKKGPSLFASFSLFLSLAVLDPAEVGGVVAEALAAGVQAVLANHALVLAAHAAGARALADVESLARLPDVGMDHFIFPSSLKKIKNLWLSLSFSLKASKNNK